MIQVLCSLGLFIAGYIFYSSALIEVAFAREFSLTSWQIGLAQAAIPLGAMMGAMIAGKLSDLFGRHRLLLGNFILLVAVSLLNLASFDFTSLCITRLLNGFLAGTLYPLCAAYLTEMTPHDKLARNTAKLMFINCLAAPFACLVTMALAFLVTEAWQWRITASFAAIPSLVAFIWIRRLPESHAWLICHEKNPSVSFNSMKTLFSKHYKQITLCLIAAWFLMDIAYYGVNFFVPYILQSLPIHTHTTLSTFIINLFFMLGAFIAIFVVDRVDLLKLQTYGFLFSSLGLLLLAAYFHMGLHHQLMIILLFTLFNMALNIGPDVTTYMLSATSYPVDIRGTGHGLVAGFAKFGSFIGVLFLPRLQELWGNETIILLLSLLLFLACLFTTRLGKLTQKTMIATEEVYSYEKN